jgi:hypothetical protein
MRALNVAEKPSVAKELANILSGGRSQYVRAPQQVFKSGQSRF